MKWNDIDVYPRGHDPYGNDIVQAHAAISGSDLVVTNIDPFVLNNYGGRGFAWLPITPVAGDPLSPVLQNSIRGAVDIVSISEFGQQILKEAGVSSEMIRLPIPTGFFHPLDRVRTRDAFRWDRNAYIIGHVGMNRGWRKGHDVLLRAFQVFLTEVPNAYLWLHTDVEQHDGINLRKLIESMGLAGRVMYPNRYDAFMGKSSYWMNAFYNAIDLYVQPSLNEGQGMPIFEAMSTGQPIVATNATAITEIIQDADAIAIEPKGQRWQPIDCWGYEVSEEDLANGMFEAYRKYGKGFVSLRNREIAIDMVSMEEIAHRWMPELQKVERQIRYTPIARPWKERPKVIQVSTIKSNCGIGQYTQALMKSMSEATEQEIVDILEVGKSITEFPKCELLHLHYEGAIWPLDDTIKQMIMKARYRGTKVICTYHAIQPEAIAYHVQNKMVDLAVVHWPILNMKFDSKKVWVLGGMGCPVYNPPRIEKRDDYREEYGFRTTDKVISTFGFAARGRGHTEVLEKLAPMMKGEPGMKMQLILPENFLNKEGFDGVHLDLRTLAKDYGIENQVVVISHFLSDVEILNRLWMSDVGYLYIENDTLSTSSAARFFISARLPLVISPSSHFEDMRRGVVRSSFFLPEFAQDIWDMAHNNEKLNKLRVEQEGAYRQFNWPRFGESYFAAYKRAIVG